MDVDMDMDTSPSNMNPKDLTVREQFRRYGKRHSATSISPLRECSTSKFSESRLLYDGQSIHSPTNAALFLENIKQEAESIVADHSEGTPARTQSASKWRSSIDGHGMTDMDTGTDSVCYSLKACKLEDDSFADVGDTTFALFASLLDSAIQGLMPIPDLIQSFERSCRNVSESMRYGSNVQHRVVEDKLMRQKAQLLLDQAASWSLLWYLFEVNSRLRQWEEQSSPSLDFRLEHECHLECQNPTRNAGSGWNSPELRTRQNRWGSFAQVQAPE